MKKQGGRESARPTSQTKEHGLEQETQLARDARISQIGQGAAWRYLERKESEALRSGAIRELLAAVAFMLLIYVTTIILLAL